MARPVRVNARVVPLTFCPYMTQTISIVFPYAQYSMNVETLPDFYAGYELLLIPHFRSLIFSEN